MAFRAPNAIRSWLRDERTALGQPFWGTTLLTSGLLLATLIGIEATRRYQNTRNRSYHEQEQAIGVLQAYARQTRLTALDWAHWDDSLDFVEGRNPGFPHEYLDTTSLISDGAMMAILGKDGRTLASAGASPVDLADTSPLSRCIHDVDRTRRTQKATHLSLLCASEDQLYVGSLEAISNNNNTKQSNGSLAFLSPVLTSNDLTPAAASLSQLHQRLLKPSTRTKTQTGRDLIMPALWTEGGHRVARPELALLQPLLQEWLDLALLTSSLMGLTVILRMRWLLALRKQRLNQRRSEQHYKRRIRKMAGEVEQLLDQTQHRGDADAKGAFARLLSQQNPNPIQGTLHNSEEHLTSRLEQVLACARSLVLVDALTNLPNRNYFLEKLEWESSYCQKADIPVVLLFINIDKFKKINETYGHKVGDQILMHVSSELKRLTSKDDFLARFGNDEFSLIVDSQRFSGLNNDETRERVHQLAKDLLKRYRSRSSSHPENLRTNLSIGVSLSDPQIIGPEEMIRRSDMAMMIAKNRSTTPISIFDIDDNGDTLNDYRIFNALESDISEAPERFEILFQPIVDAHGTPFAMEALTRWHNPDFNGISPEIFFSMSERYRLIHQLGEVIITRTLSEFKALQRKHPEASDINLAINISPSQLLVNNFGPWLLKRLRIHGINPENVTIEVTESAIIEPSEELCDNLHIFRQAGIKLALDDFGTGYSSLRLLMWLKPNELKIDKSFVMAAVHDPLAQQIVQLLQQLTSVMNLKLVAEGVEDAAMRDLLLHAGVHYFQGFFYARPMPAHQVLSTLAQTSPPNH